MSYMATRLQPTDDDRLFPWIAYRASVARADRRCDAVVCPSCGCELDVFPASHSPRCTEVNK